MLKTNALLDPSAGHENSSVPAVRASTATLHHNLGNVRDAESKQVSQISFH